MDVIPFNDDEYRERLLALTEAIKLNTSNFIAYVDRAAIYRLQNQYHNALLDIVEAIKLNPHYTKAYEILGTLKMDIGEYIEASICFANIKKLKNYIDRERLLSVYNNVEYLSDLHIAAYYGNQEAAKLLLTSDVDVNVKNAKGYTPLIMAVLGGHEIIAEMLIADGANVNIEDNYGNTPLHYSVKYKGLVKILLKNHADPNVLNFVQIRTPLEIAVSEGLPEVAELMIIAGANPAIARDINGMTKLHHAVLNSNLKDIKILLSQGAKINYKNNIGQTPLHIATMSGNIDACQLLLEKGANSNAPDDNGKSPLQLAFDSGNDELTDLLIACSTIG